MHMSPPGWSDRNAVCFLFSASPSHYIVVNARGAVVTATTIGAGQIRIVLSQDDI